MPYNEYEAIGIFVEKMTIFVNFFEKKNQVFWQFFYIQMAFFRHEVLKKTLILIK